MEEHRKSDWWLAYLLGIHLQRVHLEKNMGIFRALHVEDPQLRGTTAEKWDNLVVVGMVGSNTLFVSSIHSLFHSIVFSAGFIGMSQQRL